MKLNQNSFIFFKFINAIAFVLAIMLFLPKQVSGENKPSSQAQKPIIPPSSAKAITEAIAEPVQPRDNAQPYSKKEIKKIVKATKQNAGDDQLLAFLLALFLGWFGIHRFYLGYIWQGVVQFFFGWALFVWVIIDIVRIFTGDLKPIDGDYSRTL